MGIFLRTLILLLCLSVFTAQGWPRHSRSGRQYFCEPFMAVSYGLDGIATGNLVGQALGPGSQGSKGLGAGLAGLRRRSGEHGDFWAFGPELLPCSRTSTTSPPRGRRPCLGYRPPLLAAGAVFDGYLLAPRRALRCAIPCWRLR